MLIKVKLIADGLVAYNQGFQRSERMPIDQKCRQKLYSRFCFGNHQIMRYLNVVSKCNEVNIFSPKCQIILDFCYLDGVLVALTLTTNILVGKI